MILVSFSRAGVAARFTECEPMKKPKPLRGRNSANAQAGAIIVVVALLVLAAAFMSGPIVDYQTLFGSPR